MRLHGEPADALHNRTHEILGDLRRIMNTPALRCAFEGIVDSKIQIALLQFGRRFTFGGEAQRLI
jgi:hypothetical protein